MFAIKLINGQDYIYIFEMFCTEFNLKSDGFPAYPTAIKSNRWWHLVANPSMRFVNEYGLNINT